jgi:hypothetical protein
MMSARALVIVVALSATCGGGPTAPQSQRVASGQWGGQHVGMDVTDTGAQLEFDCAHGRIDEPLTLGESGRFEAKGTYTPERPGPRREDDDKGRAVRYVGRVTGKSMTLSIEGADGSTDTIASFTLDHGKAPVIRKCL